MKLFVALIGIFFFSTFSIFPTTINGRLTVLNTDNSKLSVLLQINTNTGIDDIGGATIIFGFDTNAVRFTNTPIKNVDYIFHNFDGGHYSSATITKPMKNKIWANIDLLFSNNNNGTVVAGSPGWTDVVTLKFDVVNPNITPGLTWFMTSLFWGIYDANHITLWNTGEFEGNFGLVVDIRDGWNMVTVPGINPDGMGTDDWWRGKNPSYYVYRLIGGNYIAVTSTAPGEGYWMNHIGANVYNTGDEWPAGGIQRVPNETINVSLGWNMIGGFEKIVPTNQITTTPPGLINGYIYTYSDQYQIATSIEPGRGYLVKMNGSGQINFSSGLIKENEGVTEFFKSDWGRIVFIDDSKRNYSLYLVNENIDLKLYELPPVPPPDGFDIRFASGRMVENSENGVQLILMSGIDYPIKVKVENINITLMDELNNIIYSELKPGEEITITSESIDKLLIGSSHSATPVKFYLEQNYPNPFNPSTKIKFTIPKESNVELIVYNILGELVSTLVHEQLNAGYHEYKFHSSDLASGIYIYRIKAGDFVETRKMVLLR